MLSKLFNALEKTRFSLLGAFKNIKQGKISLDDLEKIEEQLLLADVGLNTVENIIDILKNFSDDNHHARGIYYLHRKIYSCMIMMLALMVLVKQPVQQN